MTAIANFGDILINTEHWIKDIERGKLKYLEKHLPPLPLCAQKFPNGPALNRIRNAADKGRRLTA